MLRFSDLPPERERGARSVARVARPRHRSPISSTTAALGLADHIFNRPLAITESGAELLLAHINVTTSALTVRDDFTSDDDPDYLVSDSVAVIRIAGPLLKNRSSLTDFFSITTYESLTAKFLHALANPAVAAILFDIDSPGGECAGCADLSDLIYSSRGHKRIWALSNDSMYSAAYWIGSAADQVFVSRDAGAGSIGCYMMHLDRSGLDEQCGLKFSYIFSGPRKVDGNTHEALSDRARATLQAEVNRTTDIFVGTVSRNRGVDAREVYRTESGIFFASACVPLLADRCSSLDETMMSLRVAARLPLTPGAGAFSQTKSAAAVTMPRTIAPAPAARIAPAPAPTPARLPARRLTALPTVTESAMISAALARLQCAPPARLAMDDAAPIAVIRASAVAVAVTSPRNVRLLVAPYNSPSSDLGGFREVYAPGCFAAGLGEDIIALLNHDERWLLGRKSAGNVNVYDSAEGLRCDLTLPDDVSYADDVWQLLQTGIIKASSAGFWLVRSHNEVRAGEKIRVIERALLREIALVAVPAYPQATAQPAANRSLQIAAARLRLLKAQG